MLRRGKERVSKRKSQPIPTRARDRRVLRRGLVCFLRALTHQSIPSAARYSPRYDLSHTDIEDWVGRLLPSRLFGVIVITSASGILDHEEARRKKVGGKVLGFFY